MEINATLVVQIVLFLLLLAWLSRFLFAPLLELFDERERRIEGARLEAQALQQSAHQKLELVEERIRQAQKEARQLLASLKAEGVEYQRQILDAAKKQAKQKSEEAQKRLAEQVLVVKSQLNHQVPALVTEVLNHFLDHKHDAGSSQMNTDKMESRSA